MYWGRDSVFRRSVWEGSDTLPAGSVHFAACHCTFCFCVPPSLPSLWLAVTSSGLGGPLPSAHSLHIPN